METRQCCVALGSFDGLHIGHRAVLDAAATQREAGLEPCALLFQNHPQSLLSGCAPKQLLSEAARNRLLAHWGLRGLTLPFSDLQPLSPQSFVTEILSGKLNAKAVCCGYNYRFGQGGQGDAALLARLCAEAGIRVLVTPAVRFGAEPVSSTRIRSCLERGELTDANTMLGRAFSYAYPVIAGDRRGRRLGWPTINQAFPDDMAVPRLGVYASRVLADGLWRQGVTNIGLCPTFTGQILRSETHIRDFDGDLYGQVIPVELLVFLRGERRFQSEEALKAQIEQDAAEALRSCAENA